jgi:hypothetical protein
VDLVTYLSEHAGRLEWSARGVAKKRNLLVEDAKQHVLLAAADLLQDVVVDLDGKHTHLRYEPEYYRAVELRSKSFGAYIAVAAERFALDDLKGKQREFDDDIQQIGAVPPCLVDIEPGIVIRDLIDRALTFSDSKGLAYVGVLGDILANEGLADYGTNTISQWNAEFSRAPQGRSQSRIPHDFIFKVHGLTAMQGRFFVRQVADFMKNNGFNRRAA